MRARLADLPLLVLLLGIAGALAFVPALHALALGEHPLSRDFFYAGLALLILTVILGIATASLPVRDGGRSLLAALVGAYLVLPVAMMLPLRQALPDTTNVNAWFEMVSSFTTTGASVYAAERLPETVHLWRALVGWYGGFLVLLGAHAILAPLNLGGFEVTSGRVPGRASLAGAARMTEAAPRLGRFALKLLPVYGGLTLVLWVGLMLAGAAATPALIHSMGTLSTSGITGQTGLAAGGGLAAEALVLIFLVFAVTRHAMPGVGPVADRRGLWHDPELRLAALVIAVVTAILVLRYGLVADAGAGGSGALAGLWGVVFTATSFLTTTGYVSGEWQAAGDWSGIGTPGLILMALAIIGGGTATAAGGVKLLRIYALLRHGKRELERIIHPSSIGAGGGEARRLHQDGAQLAWVFFMLFGISIAVLAAILTLLGLDFERALVLTIAAITTTGQLADLAAASPIAYADLSDPVKLALGLAMIIGRLETLALLALVLPARGRR